jgi:hypothetical protein
MVQPFDYSLNIQRPDQALASGFQMGAQMRDARIKMQAAEAAALEKAQLQEATLAYSRAKTPAEKVAVMERYPAFAKPISDQWNSYEDAVKKPIYDAGLQGYAALQGGNPALAAQTWRNTGTAFTNSNRPDLAKTFNDLADVAEKDPNAADLMASTFLARTDGAAFKQFGEATGRGDTAFQKDYAFIKNQFGQAAADTFANSKIDETAMVPLPNGKGVYVGPRSGLAAALNGTTPAAMPGTVSVTLPNGNVASFPNQAAANAFKLKAGIN